VACNPIDVARSGGRITVKMLMKDVRLDMEDASHVTTLALDWSNQGIAVIVFYYSIDDGAPRACNHGNHKKASICKLRISNLRRAAASQRGTTFCGQPFFFVCVCVFPMMLLPSVLHFIFIEPTAPCTGYTCSCLIGRQKRQAIRV
jgi:hypothetical protein